VDVQCTKSSHQLLTKEDIEDDKFSDEDQKENLSEHDNNSPRNSKIIPNITFTEFYLMTKKNNKTPKKIDITDNNDTMLHFEHPH